MTVVLEEDQYGLYTNPTTGKSTSVRLFTWKNANNIIVQVINYGATIVSIKVPDKNGKIVDIVTGFDNMEGYLNKNNPYFGATIGRVANRIANGQIRIGDTIYQVNKNLNNKHQLHGGFQGFDKVLWDYHIDGNRLILSYHSNDLEEGYPGDLVVNVFFELTDNNHFDIKFQATTTKPTVVNLTNHSYFNLAGHNAGAEELYKHIVCINADRITEVDSDAIPTGNLIPVCGTIFDLQIPKKLGDVINSVPNNDGYDHNFCITKGTDQCTTFISRIIHPDSGRVLEIYSNQPGVQFYTSNFLPENPKLTKQPLNELITLNGKGANYYKHGALCFETQNYPDAPNHDNFPKSILNPGEIYNHYVSYRFSIKDD